MDTTGGCMDTTWLVAYDFSRLAHAALATAVDMLGKLGGGRLVAVHAHQIRTGIDGDVDPPTPLATELERAYVEDAERQLREDVAATVAPGVRLEQRVIPGRPASVVCRTALEHGASLIVVGSHGRRGVERLLLGSVAEAIMRQARCSVLVVKEPLPDGAKLLD